MPQSGWLRLRLVVVLASLSLIPNRNNAAQSLEGPEALRIDRKHNFPDIAIRVGLKDDESRIRSAPSVLRIRGGQANCTHDDNPVDNGGTKQFRVVVEGDTFCSAGRLVMLNPAQMAEPWAAANAGLLGRIGDPPFPTDAPPSKSGQLLVIFDDPLDPYAGIGSDQLAEGWFDVSVNGSQSLVYFEHSPAAFIALAEAAQVHLGHLPAQRLYAQALELDPKSGLALNRLGEIAHRVVGDALSAEALLAQAIAIDPQNVDYLTNYALVLADERFKEYNRSEALLVRVLKQDRHHARALCGYALLLQEEHGNVAGAEYLFHTALKTDPTNADALCGYATYLGKVNNEYHKAEELYKLALLSDPTHMHSLLNYGLLLQAVKQAYHEALGAFDRALHLSPQHAPALSFRGLLLHAVYRDYQGAEAMYERAIAANPSYTTALSNYGYLIASAKKDFVAAEDLYKRAYQTDPADATLLCNYANLVEKHYEDFGRAKALYRQALAVDPSNLAVLSNLAHLLASADRDLDKAEGMLRKALALDPQYEDAKRGLGMVQREKEGMQRLKGKSAAHAKVCAALDERRRTKGPEKPRETEARGKEMALRAEQAEQMAQLLLEEEEAAAAETSKPAPGGKGGGGKGSRGARSKRRVN